MSRLCLKKCQFSLKKCCFEAQNLLVWFPWQPCIFSKNEGKFQYIVFDPLSENQVFVKICDYAWPHFGWFLHGIALKIRYILNKYILHNKIRYTCILNKDILHTKVRYILNKDTLHTKVRYILNKDILHTKIRYILN